jgi:hypothetical protein
MFMREIRVVEWWWMQAKGCLHDHALSTEAAAQNEKAVFTSSGEVNTARSLLYSFIERVRR